MKSNLKALWLALLALTTLGAITAQSARANFDTLRTFPAGSSAFVKVEADPSEPNQILAVVTGGFSTTCKEFSTTGSTVKDKTTEVTGEPHFASCTSSLGAGGSFLAHGCHFQFTSETNASELAPIHFVCPAEKESETQYSGCTLFFGTQTFSGAHYTNVGTGGAEKEMHLTINIRAEMDIAYHSSFGCQLWGIPAQGSEATYLGKLTAKGIEDSEGKEGAGQVGLTMETLSTAEMP